MKKTQKVSSKQQLGWRSYRLTVDPRTAIQRLSLCPNLDVKEKMRIDHRYSMYTEYANITYVDGMYTDEEKVCVQWILGSHIPDERKISPENAEAIFDWVRETL